MYVRTLETILYVRSNVVRSSYYHNTYFAGVGLVHSNQRSSGFVLEYRTLLSNIPLTFICIKRPMTTL
jgi:hypothetical protein